jgi:hypothetical protein
MDFREYEVTRDGHDVIVSGTIREPVKWDFTIRMTGDDIPGMVRIGLHRYTLAMAMHWLFHRKSRPSPTPEAARSAVPAPEQTVSPRAVRNAPRRNNRSDPSVLSNSVAQETDTEQVSVAAAEPVDAAESADVDAPVDAAEARRVRVEKTPEPATAEFGAPRQRGSRGGQYAARSDAAAGGDEG